MAERRAPQLGADAFARSQPRAVHELASVDALPPLDLHRLDLQAAAFPADDVDRIAAGQQASWNLALPRHCRIGRPSPDLAGLAAKAGIGARPWRESAHAIVDLPGRQRPVDATVLLCEQWRVSRLRGI